MSTFTFGRLGGAQTIQWKVRGASAPPVATGRVNRSYTFARLGMSQYFQWNVRGSSGPTPPTPGDFIRSHQFMSNIGRGMR